MSDIFFLILRRLRVPLILLISVYSIATLGMTLIPGVDDNGQPYHMSFFHAFYFVSFMGTTIGFGEIPYTFTDAQRAWVLICIYTSVIAWLYGIGNMLRLLQDETFQQAVSHRAFERSIHRMVSPFYIICGYGETGKLINQGLSELGIQTVVIDQNSEQTRSLELDNLAIATIVMTADITEPRNLEAAGINMPNCQGIIAVTQNDHTNLKIAIASKLINKNMHVICRSEIEDEAKNMASVNTNAIINPYLTFARRMSLLTHNPALHQIQSWFINQHSTEHINEKICLQGLPKGKWILCGYGRLGKAIHNSLTCDEIDITVVDVSPETSDAPEGAIVGRGTEASTLIKAGISEASLVIAASDDDANNLSILITARQLNKNITTIGRVSKETNHPLFVHARCDYIMDRSQVVANQTLTFISRPLVTKFIKYSSSLSQTETQSLIDQILALTRRTPPVTWRMILDEENAPALARYLNAGRSLTIDQLSEHKLLPQARAIPLLLQRGDVSHIMPKPDMGLRLGDEVLWCSKRGYDNLAQRLIDNNELLDSLINQNPHYIPLLRWLSRRKNN